MALWIPARRKCLKVKKVSNCPSTFNGISSAPLTLKTIPCYDDRKDCQGIKREYIYGMLTDSDSSLPCHSNSVQSPFDNLLQLLEFPGDHRCIPVSERRKACP